MDKTAHYILDFMGYLASFVITLTPDNYLFVELAVFLLIIFLISAAGLYIACALTRRGR